MLKFLMIVCLSIGIVGCEFIAEPEYDCSGMEDEMARFILDCDYGNRLDYCVEVAKEIFCREITTNE